METLYGFFHNTYIYELDAALVSLHKTKRGAWKAMHKHQWDKWEKARSPEDTNLHLSKWFRKGQRCARDEFRHTRSHIAPVELQP